MLLTPTTRAPRRLVAIVASALTLALGFSGIAATTTLQSATAAGTNPLATLNGFTVVTQGDATFGNAGEIEGSLAVGGNLSFAQYNLAPNQDGSALPSVDGLSNVGLFVGGTVAFPGNGKFDINGGGIARITGTSGMSVSADKRLYAGGNQQAYLKSQAGTQTTLANYTATPGAYAAAFPSSTFTGLVGTSSSYAAITSTGGEYVVVGPLGNPGGEPVLTLTSGKVNVWNVSSAVLAGKTAFQFANGVTPSASTPLIINVTDGNGGTMNAVRVGDKTTAPYVLWNFPGWTALEITGSAQLNGSILAPSAAVKNSNGSETNGQIAAKSFVSNTGAEIHHYGFSFTPPEKKTVAGSWSSTTACATPSNQLVVGAVAGVTYTWTAGGTGTFTSFSQTGLSGTYAFSVSVSDPSQYTLGANPASFSVTFTSPVDCAPPSTECIPPKLVHYTYTAATNSGTVTVPNPAGYNGLLCQPFWVTAVAWTYTTTAVWPQALDIENPMSNNEGGVQITKAGTYSYGAPVACGQGDIYASFVSQKQTSPTLSGVAMLNGPQTPFPEHFLHGMGFTGPTPTYTQAPAGCNKATPVAPAATAIEECDTDGSVVVGSGSAAVALTAASPTATRAGVVYILTAGNGTSGAWEVTATPAQNRYFDGPQKVVFSGDLKARTVCEVPPAPVSGSATTSAETCSATDYASTDPADYSVALGSVTAVSSAGVSYELWNAAKTARIAVLNAGVAYPIAGGSYAVKVLPASPAYSVSTANEWIPVVVAANAKICEVIGDPVKSEQCVPDATDLTSSTWSASLTIVAAAHVQYRVYLSDGTTFVDQGVWAPGTYAVGTAKLPYGSVVKVVAEPESGWSLLAPKSWDYQFSKAVDCNLPTFGTVTPEVVFAQTCEAGPTYRLSITGGVAGSVLWSVNNGPQTTALGTFPASAGSQVTIVAKPAPGAGFDGKGQDALQRTFTRTFTDAAPCDLETLALTGQNVTGYLVVAVLLFQVGLALVAVPFVRARRKARHLAI